MYWKGRIGKNRTVTLPSEVCERLGIQEGDILDADIRNGHLTLTPRNPVPPSNSGDALAEPGKTEQQLEQRLRHRSRPVSPDVVFEKLRREQESGELTRALTEGRVWYEGSISHPGLIDRIQPDGTRETGHFRNGEFVPIKK